MEFWIVVEEEYGEVCVYPFNCLEMARGHLEKICRGHARIKSRDHVKKVCGGIVRIERHIMNVGFQVNEDLDG